MYGGRCYRLYAGSVLVFGSVGAGRRACIVMPSGSSIKGTRVDLLVESTRRRPIQRVVMDMQMGKGYRPSESYRRRYVFSVGSAGPVNSSVDVYEYVDGRL